MAQTAVAENPIVEAVVEALPNQEPQKEKEPRSKFLKRIVVAANEMSDKAWGKLSEEAQAWVNTNINAWNKLEGKERDAYKFGEPDAPADATDEDDDDDEEEAEAGEADGGGEEEAAAPAAKRGKKDAAAPAAKKGAKGEKEPAKKKEPALAADGSKRGGTGVFRKLAVQYPNDTVEKLKERVTKKGYGISDVSANLIFQTTGLYRRVFSDAGWLRDKPEKAAAAE